MREIHGEREITPAMYVRAQKNRGNLTREDFETVFTEAERFGYGAGTNGYVFERDGRFFVPFYIYDSCD